MNYYIGEQQIMNFECMQEQQRKNDWSGLTMDMLSCYKLPDCSDWQSPAFELDNIAVEAVQDQRKLPEDRSEPSTCT